MSDEITAARRKKRRKVQARRFFWFLVALVVIFGAIAVVNSVTKTTFLDIGDFATTLFKGGGGYPVVLGEHAPIQAERMSMAFAVLTPNQLLTFSSGGARLMEADHSFLNPCIAAAGNRLVLYNASSRDVEIYNRSQYIAGFKTEYAIIDAAVAEDGMVAVLTQSERRACQLEVYRNGDYKRLFTWYDGSAGFPTGVYVDEKSATVAVARVITHDGRLYTLLTSIDISSASVGSDAVKAENYEIEFEGLTLAAYFDGENLIVATDQAGYLLDGAGNITASYEFPHESILRVARNQGKGLAVAFGDNLQSAINSVVILSRNLKEQCVIHNCGLAEDMVLTSTRLYLLGGGRVSEYDTQGNLKKQYEVPYNAFAMLELNGLVVILPDQAIRPNKTISQEN